MPTYTRRQNEESDSLNVVRVLVLAYCVLLAYIIEPVGRAVRWPLWFLFRSYRLFVSDTLLEQDYRIPDPNRERLHILAGWVSACAAASGAWYALHSGLAWPIVPAFAAAMIFAGLTQAYHENIEENVLYPTIGGD